MTTFMSRKNTASFIHPDMKVYADSYWNNLIAAERPRRRR